MPTTFCVAKKAILTMDGCGSIFGELSSALCSMLTDLTRRRMMQSRCTHGAKANANSSVPLTTCTLIKLDAGDGSMSLWPSKCQSSACECLDNHAWSGTWPLSFQSSSMRYLMETESYRAGEGGGEMPGISLRPSECRLKVR